MKVIFWQFQIFTLPQAFGEDFLEDKLKPFFKSDPIPESVSYLILLPTIMLYLLGVSCLTCLRTWWQNDGDVKIVVGTNFDEIVLDESKDVLLEVQLWPSSLQVIFASKILQSCRVNLMVDGISDICSMVWPLPTFGTNIQQACKTSS